MRCRQCGTEIAEKALICYKCGTAVTEAKYAPVPIPDRATRHSAVVMTTLAALAGVGLYAGLAGAPEGVRLAGWAVTAAALLALAVRLVRRFRG